MTNEIQNTEAMNQMHHGEMKDAESPNDFIHKAKVILNIYYSVFGCSGSIVRMFVIRLFDCSECLCGRFFSPLPEQKQNRMY